MVSLDFNLLGVTIASFQIKVDEPTDNSDKARGLRQIASRVETSAFDRALNQAVKRMTRWWAPRMTR